MDSVDIGLDVCVRVVVDIQVGLGDILCFDVTAMFGVDVILNNKTMMVSIVVAIAVVMCVCVCVCVGTYGFSVGTINTVLTHWA